MLPSHKLSYKCKTVDHLVFAVRTEMTKDINLNEFDPIDSLEQWCTRQQSITRVTIHEPTDQSVCDYIVRLYPGLLLDILCSSDNKPSVHDLTFVDLLSKEKVNKDEAEYILEIYSNRN